MLGSQQESWQTPSTGGCTGVKDAWCQALSNADKLSKSSADFNTEEKLSNGVQSEGLDARSCSIGLNFKYPVDEAKLAVGQFHGVLQTLLQNSKWYIFERNYLKTFLWGS